MPEFNVDDSLIFDQFSRRATSFPGLPISTILQDTQAVLGFNPFLQDIVQANRLLAQCQVIVNGVDVTARLEPHLIAVRITLAATKSCELELDDRDGSLPIPPVSSSVEVSLGWSHETMRRLFTGLTWDLEHGGDKQQGRRMWVHARAHDQTSDVKTPMSDSAGDGAEPGQMEGKGVPFQQMISQVMKNGGGSADVHPALANVMQDHWSQNAESPMNYAQRLAGDLGAVFQLGEGNKATLTLAGYDTSGARTDQIAVEWNKNLISWRVRPFSSRGAWGGASQQSYDTQKGNWLQTAQKMAGAGSPFSDAIATYMGASPAANESNAGNANQGSDNKSSFEPGYGRIVCIGEPRLEWNTHIFLGGVRPGVNGDYTVASAEHVYDKEGGYVTWCDVQINASRGSDSVGRGYPVNKAPNVIG